MNRKNWAATGSFLKEDRPRALDLLGVASQLLFNTFLNGHFVRSGITAATSISPTVSRAPTTAR